MSRPWVIYGAYGFTGSVVVDRAVAAGMRPLLAGVDRSRLSAQANYYRLPWKECPLEKPLELDELLNDAAAVLNCAGPFARSAEPLVESCLRTGTHYLDIAGEPQVFEMLAERDSRAQQAGVMVLPGVGLDIVPSDYLASYLKKRLPTATRLVLGFNGLQRASRGAINTLVDTILQYPTAPGLNGGPRVPVRFRTAKLDFGEGPQRAIRVPWGDIVSARHATGIPQVEVYLALPAGARFYLRGCKALGPLARLKLVRTLLSGAGAPPRVENELWSRAVRGEEPAIRHGSAQRTVIYGEVSNERGGVARALFRGPDSYTILTEAALAAVARVLDGQWVSGFHTPTRVYGCELVDALSGAEFEDVDDE